VIDPALAYSTYLGGGAWDEGWAVAVDGSSHAYLAGVTFSPNFPGTTVPGPAGPYDAFVTKLDPSGTGILYSTYLGGNGAEQAFGIAVDATGAAYVTGFTSSTNFPTAGPTVSAYGGGPYDAFVTKLDPSGSAIVLSRYLGGSSADEGRGIAVDANGFAYVTGWTVSSNFPTTAPPILQSTYGGFGDAFVTKLDATTFGLTYSTYLGGATSGERGYGVAVDLDGFAYVAGHTGSTDFPVQLPALQASYAGGNGDAFVAKLDRVGAKLLYSTYLGGSAFDQAHAIFVDRGGKAYVTGMTESTNFPTKLPTPTANAGGEDAFVAKLDASGASLVYSRYLGGSGQDRGWGIGVWDGTFTYVTGETSSANFPLKKPVQGTLAGSSDAFVTSLDAFGAGLFFSTYLGGNGYDRGLGIAVQQRGGAAYVTGGTGSTNFPTAPTPPLQASMAGMQDGFITKIVPAAADLSVVKVAPGFAFSCDPLSYWITVTNNGPDDATQVTLTDTLPAGLSPIGSSATIGFCTPGVGTVSCDLSPLPAGASATVSVVVIPSSIGPILDTATVTGREPDLDSSNNTAVASTVIFDPWWCWFFGCPVC
jgi:uncharacterized repeat protein (TIGR01451 family)